MTTLTTIREKIRKVTARPSSDQISDAEIDEYINTWYLYDMPQTLSPIDLNDTYYFTTDQNVDEYDFDKEAYINTLPPAYCDGYQMLYTQNKKEFLSLWPKLQSKQQVATGDGTPGPYTFTISTIPFLRSNDTPMGTKGVTANVLISGPTSTSASEAVYDDGTGGWVNAAAGSVNYITGACTITFSDSILDGEPIYAHVHPYSASRPNTIFFYEDKFTLRPVPDGAYTIEVAATRRPTAFLNDADSPQLSEWWQVIAYGAALKIFTDAGDFDQYQAYRPFYEEQLILCGRRTLKQLSTQKVKTIYDGPNLGDALTSFWPGY